MYVCFIGALAPTYIHVDIMTGDNEFHHLINGLGIFGMETQMVAASPWYWYYIYIYQPQLTAHQIYALFSLF